MTTVKEAGLATIDMKLEVIVIPVSDAERAELFYRKLGWRQDAISIHFLTRISSLTDCFSRLRLPLCSSHFAWVIYSARGR